MTILDDRPVVGWQPAFPAPARGARRPVPARSARPFPAYEARPFPARPAIAPLRYRGTGIAVSRAAHGHRPVGTAVTVALAAMAALITLWLGALANFSGDRAAAPAAVPERLAVVQVQAGETLQQLAGRVAPEAPAGQIVDRIRDLNQLDSAAVDAGQTLIAPVA
jgi:4-amino-4-deoxy-L-arabinose transferase-like glycosyltransferase